MRIVAFVFFAASIWIPLLCWGRMSQVQRYVAMVALGAAFVFYQYHPTHTACELDVAACDSSGY